MSRRTLLIAAAVILMLAGMPAQAQVKAWEEKVTLPTWETGPSQVHPIFADGGREIYPYTLNETLTDRKSNKAWNAVFLENEYIKVMVMPEIGGRLHGAVDKSNGFEFFYWQKTIKPGLISMTGAWISGGIEWNFPHAHRPSGFMPVEHRIICNADGSATVWVGETEPIFRMRWLVGMTVFPGRSYVQANYVFINPTANKHSFMVWATAATAAGDSVQAQYPGDMVTGHDKHEFWNWPVHEGVDMTWWKNVPNAASYFAFNNPSEWFGTYDHAKQAGTAHVGNHYIVMGKKLWTWGAGPSGRIWEDILSDGMPPYYEPQAGVYSDNQPDYHWLNPYEVKTAHDYWYPVRGLRGYHNASKDFAVNTDLKDGKAFGGVNATALMPGCKVVLKDTKNNRILKEAVATIAPDKPYSVEVPVGAEAQIYDLHLAVYDAKGKLAIEVQQHPPKKVELPPDQQEPGDPKAMTGDELYRAGEWLDRFRRTKEALVYYEEALRRDPKDSRVNIEMGFLALKQGKWEEGLRYLNTALAGDNDNARIYYGKGLAYAGMRKYQDAYDQFYRAVYGYEYFSPAYLNLAKIDILRGDYRAAIAKLAEAETQNGKSAEIPAFRAAAYRHLGNTARALAAANRAMELDALHFMGGYEKSLAAKAGDPWPGAWKTYMRDAAQNYLELAAVYSSAGLYAEADDVLARYSQGKDDAKLNPMVSYFRGYFKELAGKQADAAAFYAKARKGPAEYTLPHRLEEKAALEAAIKTDPQDGNAHLFLGNLLYAMGQREVGYSLWSKSAELNAGSSLAWRNVGYGRQHLKEDHQGAYEAYLKAFSAGPQDARILLELDQLAERLKVSNSDRLARMFQNPGTVQNRDDLIGRLIDLRLEKGGAEDLQFAYDTLKNRHFRSWEGRYGIHNAWVEVNRKLGDGAFARKDYQTALAHYRQAAQYPKNLEVAPRTPDFQAHINWDMARVYTAMGQQDVAKGHLEKILAEKYGRVHLGHYFQAMAEKALGRQQEYEALLAKVEQSARERTSGRSGRRGGGDTDQYLLALVLGEKGDKAAAAEALSKALSANPSAARQALLEAQIDIARAHQ